MKRREFLIGSTAAVAAASRVFAQGASKAASAPDPAKVDRIAIMAYSFQRVLKVPGQASAPEKTVDVFELGEMFADRYKVHNIEMQHNYFESTDEAFLKSFVARLAKTKSKVSNINLELGTMSIAAATPTPVAASSGKTLVTMRATATSVAARAGKEQRRTTATASGRKLVEPNRSPRKSGTV